MSQLEFSRIFVAFEAECSRFRPLKLWPSCGRAATKLRDEAKKAPTFHGHSKRGQYILKNAPQQGLLLGVKQRISDNFEKNPNAEVSQLVKPFCLGGSLREAVASLCGPAEIEEAMYRALA